MRSSHLGLMTEGLSAGWRSHPSLRSFVVHSLQFAEVKGSILLFDHETVLYSIEQWRLSWRVSQARGSLWRAPRKLGVERLHQTWSDSREKHLQKWRVRSRENSERIKSPGPESGLGFRHKYLKLPNCFPRARQRQEASVNTHSDLPAQTRPGKEAGVLGNAEVEGIEGAVTVATLRYLHPKL